MKIAMFSDTHGCLGSENVLPIIENNVDIILIAGDIIPLKYQNVRENSKKWFEMVFLPWVKKQKAKRIIFIGGNHDKYFEQYRDEFINLIKKHGLSEKLVYLCDELYEFDGKKFYGTPWVEKLKNWAFYTDKPKEIFDKIPNCDVLITHMAPCVEKVGCSYPNTTHERDYGSYVLANVILDKKIPIVVCGHVHTGTHGGVKILNTMIYNVSIVNENYEKEFEPTYIDIEINKE